MAKVINTVATHRVSFLGIDVAVYNVIGFGNATGVVNYQVLPAGIGQPITAFVATNPQFWIETTSEGTNTLCTTKRVGAGLLWGSFAFTSGGGPTGRVAQVFELVLNENGDEQQYMPKAQS